MKREKPPKPYETFPLFAHSKGYWCKTIDGRHVPFGKWVWPNEDGYERSWRAALDKFHKRQEDEAHGRLVAARSDQVTIETMVDAYLTHQHARAVGKSPEILEATFSEIRRFTTEFRDVVGPQSTIAELEAFDPIQPGASPVHCYVEQMNRRYGWYAFNKRMTILSGMWRWAKDPVRGVLDRPFRLESFFAQREAKLKRREKRLRSDERGKQRFTPDELNAFFTHARQPLRAMLKLMYFAAFGNSDCADVPKGAINFDPDKELGLPEGWGVEFFIRPKTEIERAAVLPKCVIDDLKEAIAMRPEATGKRWENRIFLTHFGVPWVRDAIHWQSEDPENPVIDKTVPIDSIGQEFGKLRARLGKCPKHGWFAGPATRGEAEEALAGGRGSTSHAAGEGTKGKRKYRKRGTGQERIRWKPAPPACCPKCQGPLTPMRKFGAYTFRHTAITYASGVADMDTLHLFEGHAIQGVRREYVEEIEVHRLRAIAERLLAKLTVPTQSAANSPSSSGAAAAGAPPLTLTSEPAAAAPAADGALPAAPLGLLPPDRAGAA
jgi:integrase